MSLNQSNKHSDRKRLKVLFIPAWYPTPMNPIAGIFIKEHAKAVSRYHDVVVLYAYFEPASQSRLFISVNETIDECIRTIMVGYGGILNFFYKVFSDGPFHKETGKSQPKSLFNLFGSNLILYIFKKPLRILFLTVKEVIYFLSVFVTFRRVLEQGFRPDIIHAHIFTAGVPAVVLGRLYRIPVIISEHWSAFPRRRITFVRKLKARFAMNRADVILTVSNNLKSHIELYGIKNRFQIVPNAVDTNIFQPLCAYHKQRDAENKRLLSVGSLVPVKGIPYLLQAISFIKDKRQDFYLDIVGDGAERDNYEKLAKKLQLDDVVKFHGFKPKQEIAEFMRKSDFFVLSSIWENQPCVLIEAMACGLPVIATDVGGVREIVGIDRGIVVPSRDVSSLSRAIEFMLDNLHTYSAEKIAEYAKNNFSYRTVGMLLDTIYREINENCSC